MPNNEVALHLFYELLDAQEAQDALTLKEKFEELSTMGARRQASGVLTRFLMGPTRRTAPRLLEVLALFAKNATCDFERVQVALVMSLL